jgi:putative addiction module component (TIGR02574 family)
LFGQNLFAGNSTRTFWSPTMTATIAEVQAHALQLSAEDRAHLADTLLASLSIDNEVDDAWFAEAEQRLAELESGAVNAVSIEVAVARARSAIK